MVNSPVLQRRTSHMSTLVMPADVQLFELTTSPVFSATTLCRDFIPEFHTQSRAHDPVLKRPSRLNPTPAVPPSCHEVVSVVTTSASKKLPSSESLAIAPLRSILMVRNACLSSARSRLYKPAKAVTSPVSNKKRVVFADDRGLDLVQTKRFSDPVCLPQHLLSQCSRPAPRRELWQCQFEQPVSSYSSFCQRLQCQKVCLESVVHQADSRRLVATVQVENLCYQKHVSARVTCNDWRSYSDISATYMPPVGSGTSSRCVYDRFRVEIPVPASSGTGTSPLLPNQCSHIEFCLNFRAEDGSEFWDNNDGFNYRLQRTVDSEKPSSGPHHMKSRPLPSEQLQLLTNDIYHLKFSTWSSISSWSGTGTPYW